MEKNRQHTGNNQNVSSQLKICANLKKIFDCRKLWLAAIDKEEDPTKEKSCAGRVQKPTQAWDKCNKSLIPLHVEFDSRRRKKNQKRKKFVRRKKNTRHVYEWIYGSEIKPKSYCCNLTNLLIFSLKFVIEKKLVTKNKLCNESTSDHLNQRTLCCLVLKRQRKHDKFSRWLCDVTPKNINNEILCVD